VEAKTRLGFLSGIGALAALLVVVLVGGWTLVRGPVLFSSGPLSTKDTNHLHQGVTNHAQLRGKCGACHAAPWSGQTMADRCLACHDETAADITSGSNLHGRLMRTLSRRTCQGCHTEHHGATAPLTIKDSETFPHDLTPYSLQGHKRTAAGKAFACEDCHTKDLAQFDLMVCIACHRSIDAAFMTKHESDYGDVCLLCHDGKVSHGKDFNHNKLAFKLAGKHAKVACGKCHSNAASFSKNASVRDCVACHEKDDEHKGSFGNQCDQCHNVDGWGNAKFDHSIFPIAHGNHKKPSACTVCHPTDTKSYTCYGCHTHTLANTQREHRKLTPAKLAECVKCHKGGRGGD